MVDLREFGSIAALPFWLDGTEDGRRDRVLGDEVTLRELDLAGDTTLDGLPAPPLRLGTRRGGGRDRQGSRITVRVAVRVRIVGATRSALSGDSKVPIRT